MENKYFVPLIEDIRIGYECESYEWSMDEAGIPELNYDRWVKTILSGDRVGTILKYGVRGFRTPYLSKEILEADGWKEVDGDEYLFGRGVSFFFEKKFGKIPEAGSTDAPFKIIMRYDSVVNHMALQYVGEKGYENFQQQIFSGFCKDANTLKYILRLLNIK